LKNNNIRGEIMTDTTIHSEIAGRVWQIERRPGDRVAEGDTLIVLESMKMEIPVLATSDGVVKEVLVDAEEEVAEEQALVILETGG
jgi:biotin carboxyl carrier protein